MANREKHIKLALKCQIITTIWHELILFHFKTVSISLLKIIGWPNLTQFCTCISKRVSNFFNQIIWPSLQFGPFYWADLTQKSWNIQWSKNVTVMNVIMPANYLDENGNMRLETIKLEIHPKRDGNLKNVTGIIKTRSLSYITI